MLQKWINYRGAEERIHRSDQLAERRKNEDISFRATYNADSSTMVLVSSIEGKEKIITRCASLTTS